MSRTGIISAVVGGAAVLAAGTIAGVAVVNAATATPTTPQTQSRQVVADPAATPSVAPLDLPDVKEP